MFTDRELNIIRNACISYLNNLPQRESEDRVKMIIDRSEIILEDNHREQIENINNFVNG